MAKSIKITKGERINPAAIVEKLGLPVFIKPNAGGSSFGITKVKKQEEVEQAILKAWEESNEALIEEFIAAGKPVATVCHAPAVLLKAKDQNGDPLVNGKKVTGFSNSEEAAVELTDIVPYLVEDQLIEMGGIYH